MEVTLKITNNQKIDFFLELVNSLNFVDFINISPSNDVPQEHIEIIKQRILKKRNGKSTFKSWDEIKKKYEEEFIQA